MTNALTRFGSYCREFRASQGKTMANQAEALGHQVSNISAIETGKEIPSASYVEHLCDWLTLGPAERAELFRRVPRSQNVITFPRKRQVSTTVKLFRKVGKMTPAEIRALRSECQKGAPDD
jgi:transcriptional regulator with XRE-family HTH domain